MVSRWLDFIYNTGQIFLEQNLHRWPGSAEFPNKEFIFKKSKLFCGTRTIAMTIIYDSVSITLRWTLIGQKPSR